MFAGPESFLLYSQKNTISRMLGHSHDSPDIVLPIQNLRNIKALAYDPVEEYIYWADGRTKTIKRAMHNGTNVRLQSIMLAKCALTELLNVTFEIFLYIASKI